MGKSAQRGASARCVLRAAGVIAAMAVTPAAQAQTCPQERPTDPGGGLLQYADPGVVVSHDASDRIRVWYAESGIDAPADSPIGVSGAPQNVELVGAVLEEAFTAFEDWGYRAPVGDGDYAPCASNGGDGRLDVYLIAFPSGADGAAGTDRCEQQTTWICSGFILLENDFSGRGYPSFENAVRTVGPHELFHLVQNAFDAEVDRWFAEGSAQWAANTLRPELTDLERFLPAFFDTPWRALDAPAKGVTGAWLYATAIWPVFLDERYGSQLILDTYEAMASGQTPALVATDSALQGMAEGVMLPQVFLQFAAYNGATGTRAPVIGGYAQAAEYPMVDMVELAGGLGTLHQDVLAGFSAHYFVSHESRHIRLGGDPLAVAGMMVPLSDGRALLDEAQPLPADAPAESLIVVAGQRSSKVDAAFTIVAEALPEPEPEPKPAEPPEESAGCSVSTMGLGQGTDGSEAPLALWLWALLAGALWQRCAVRKSDSNRRLQVSIDLDS